MGAGVAVALLVWTIACRLAGPAAGLVAALIVAVSGSVLWTTGPLAADGIGLALALGAVAVALAHRDEPTLARAVAMGALIGASFAIKSLFAVPPAVVVAWVLLERRQWGRLAAAVGASAALVLAVAVPWGLADVWDQAVDYHLDAAGERTPGRNAAKIFTTAWDRDLLPLAALAAGLSAAGWARIRRRDAA
ncbi:MAG TPA: glycosyltransferase family 39 protein, partial [Acidimicrobiia bacterium]|nr:glycosyltransferase family 39 protein [Acidimicrobiia bacterium]